MASSARLGLVLLVTAVLSACGMEGTPGSGSSSPVEVPSGSASAAPAEMNVEVNGQGTVLQIGEAPPQLCLGAVAESYPPQCGGPEVANWDWAVVEQSETAQGVTWGTYAVAGTWDGEVFTRTDAPIPLSLYDAMPFADPLEGRQGDTDQAELERIQREIFEPGHPDGLLTAQVDRGFLSITVVYDDGSIQARMDETYGPDVVVVQSALRPVD